MFRFDVKVFWKLLNNGLTRIMFKIVDTYFRLNQSGGRRAVAAVFKELFLQMDAIEQKWLIRIILKEMKLSMGPNTILTAFHRLVLDFNLLITDIILTV